MIEPANPRDAQILMERAAGATQNAIAQHVGVSPRTVQRVEAEHRDFLDAQRREAARTFLAEFDASVRALVRTAQDCANRNQVQAFEAGCERLLGWSRGPESIVINGDVDASSTIVDARSVQLARDPDASAGELARLSQLLGAKL